MCLPDMLRWPRAMAPAAVPAPRGLLPTTPFQSPVPPGMAGVHRQRPERLDEHARLRTALAHQAKAHRAQLAAQADKHRAELLALLERAAVRPGLLERLLTVVLPNRS